MNQVTEDLRTIPSHLPPSHSPTQKKDERVRLVVLHQGPFGSHACIGIGDKSFGYEPGGIQSDSPESIKAFTQKVISGHKSVEAMTMIEFKISPTQLLKIKEQCNKPFILGESCMAVAAKIISKDVASIPFPLNISADVSLLYLIHLKERGHRNLLEIETVDGPNCNVSDPENRIHEKYARNGMLLTALAVSLVTSLVLSSTVYLFDAKKGKSTGLVTLPILIIVTAYKINDLMRSARIPAKHHLP